MKNLLFRTVFFCLSVLSLCSCRQDEETEVSNESGDLVAVNIPIEGIKVESAASALTRGSSSDSLTVTEELEDGFVLETSLMPVSLGLTRASTTTGLANNVQILCIAYKEDRTLYKYQYLTPGSPVIYLPKGERFKLVFYSYNSTTRPDISSAITGDVSPGQNGFLFGNTASLNDKREGRDNNVMWGRIDLTPVITSGTRLPGVTFTHLFSRLDWRLQSVIGNITECSGSVRNTYWNGNIKLGGLVDRNDGSNGMDVWTGTGRADCAAPLTFATVGSTEITSSKTVFLLNVGDDITLGLDRIVVDGKSFTNKTYTFRNKLKRGVDYRAVSTIKRPMSVTFQAARGGTVSPAGQQTVHAYGTVVVSTATPKPGWTFKSWYRVGPSGVKKITTTTGDITVAGSTLTIRVTKDTEGLQFEARFRGPKIEWAPGNLTWVGGRYQFGVETDMRAVIPSPGLGVFFLPGASQHWTGAGLGTRGEWTEVNDPCEKMGDGWRMPTARDWGTSTGSTGAGWATNLHLRSETYGASSVRIPTFGGYIGDGFVPTTYYAAIDPRVHGTKWVPFSHYGLLMPGDGHGVRAMTIECRTPGGVGSGRREFRSVPRVGLDRTPMLIRCVRDKD